MGTNTNRRHSEVNNAVDRSDMQDRLTIDAAQATEIAARFGLFRIDVASRTIFWSAGVAHIFGRTPPVDGWVGLDLHLASYHPDDRQVVRDRIEDAIGGRGCPEYRNGGRIVRPDGDLREVIAQGFAERNGEGRVTGLKGVLVDMTEMLSADRRLRESNELLRTTLESVNQGILMVGPDRQVRVYNRRARELLDVPSHLLCEGASFQDLLDQQEAAGEFDALSPVEKLRLQITTSGLYERERSNGTVLEVRTQSLADGGVVRTFTDVTERHTRKVELKESERRFRLLAENTTDVIIWCDLDATRRYVSPAAKALFGYEPDELVGTKPTTFVHPEDAAQFAVILDDLRHARRERVTTCQRYRHKDGFYVWVEVSFSLIRDPESQVATGWVAAVRDVTDRKAAEDALRVSEERLALALESGTDGFWDCDLTSGEISYSGRWPSILGYRTGEMDTTVDAWRASIHHEDAKRTMSLLLDHLEDRKPAFEAEYRVRSKAGDYVWTYGRGKVVSRDEHGRATRMIGTHCDISKRKDAESLIAHMAVHDALTGLPNRVLFKDRLQQAMGAAERHGRKFALLACDLDRFKAVNDSLGHSAGDALLVLLADRLKLAVREGDTIARLGGDEFAVILSDLQRKSDAIELAQGLIKVIEEPTELEGRVISIGMSVGIVIGPDDGQDIEQLYKNADIALYRAKAAGRNSFRFFEQDMDLVIAERNALEHDLREAVMHESFDLHYQPIIDVSNGDILGFEALLRWHHPRRGAISPAEFIPIAEETGLILSLGEWVLREACRQAAAWPDVRISVNVSAVQFQRPDALRRSVMLALAASRLKPDRLELEITEGVLVQDAEAAIACLHRFRDIGIRIALDDFGTGYSSLSYLRRFPFNKIKIDKSFVHVIEDATTAAIVEAVVGLAKRVGATITAEGVETRDQLSRVRNAGCTEIQGFLLSKPLSRDGASDLVQASQRQRPVH